MEKEKLEKEETDAEVNVEDEDEDEEKAVKTRDVVTGKWERVNDVAPLWMRDPKDVSVEQYEEFYKTTFKDIEAPLAWSHFKVYFFPLRIHQEFTNSLPLAQ